MARRKFDGKFVIYERGGNAYFYSRAAGARVRKALGVAWSTTREGRDHIEALARREYERIVNRSPVADSLEDLLVAWMRVIRKSKPDSARMFETHANRFSETSRNLFDALGPQLWAEDRIQEVTRTTLNKEISSLMAFLNWCKDRGELRIVPPRPVLTKGARGVRKSKQRESYVSVTRKEALAILDAMVGDGRDVMRFGYLTGLRPITIGRLETPQHWRRGQRHIEITDRIDKARFGRQLPVSDEAIRILDKYAPRTAGPIFGHHNYNKAIRTAARLVLGDAIGGKFSRYDLRHAFCSHTLDASGNIRAVQFLAGHKQMTTTNRYVHASAKEAAKVIAATNKRSRVPKSVPKRKTAKKAA